MPHGQYPEADQGKCRSCGFLSKHAKKPSVPAPRFYEAEHSERITVNAFIRHSIGYREWVETEPMCFVGEINLVQLSNADTQEETEDRLEAEINRDRKCPRWYAYMPGLSPIEHYDQMNWQLFHKALEDERSMRERSYRRQDRYFVIASLIIGIAQIIAAIILTYHESYTDHLLRRLFGE